MKRYWKVISLTAVILLTFSIYYIGSGLAKEELLGLELVTISGDEELIEGITINGAYRDDFNPDSFRLTNEGITYASDLNYFNRYSGIYQSPTIKKLIADHRGFMRGKESIELFFEDDTMLAYVGPYSQDGKNATFEVAILDKASNDKHSFSVKIPREDPFDYMNIIEVQRVGEKIHVFTQNYYLEEDKVYIYEIDVKEEKITNHQRIINTTNNSYVSIQNDYRNVQKQPYLVLSVNEVEWDEEMQYEEQVSSELIAYHIETGEQTTIESPEDWNPYPEDPFGEETFINGELVIKDEFLYFINFSPEGIQVDKYNMEKDEIESTENISLDESIADGIIGAYPDGEQLTFISAVQENGNKIRKLFITDITTGEIQFEGEIKITNTAKELLIYDIEFYEVILN